MLFFLALPSVAQDGPIEQLNEIEIQLMLENDWELFYGSEEIPIHQFAIISNGFVIIKQSETRDHIFLLDSAHLITDQKKIKTNQKKPWLGMGQLKKNHQGAYFGPSLNRTVEIKDKRVSYTKLPKITESKLEYGKVFLPNDKHNLYYYYYAKKDVNGNIQYNLDKITDNERSTIYSIEDESSMIKYYSSGVILDFEIIDDYLIVFDQLSLLLLLFDHEGNRLHSVKLNDDFKDAYYLAGSLKKDYAYNQLYLLPTTADELYAIRIENKKLKSRPISLNEKLSTVYSDINASYLYRLIKNENGNKFIYRKKLY